MATARLNASLPTTLLVAVALLSQLTPPASAEPIGWMERFALAEDRQAMLAELIPGSDDYYFYHCLHYQTISQLERSEAVLRDWLAEHKGRETPSITAMLDRQRLLTYNDSPERTIDHLVRRLGIKLDHAPPATKNERRFPSALDPSALDVDAIVKDALRRSDQLKPKGIAHLANQFRIGSTAGIPIDLRDLLQRVTGPYVGDLKELVIKELSNRRPNDKRFGDLRAHSYLTLADLRAVAAAVPQIADDNALVTAVLRRMRPGADSDPSQQQQIRIDYLTRVESYLQTLPASYNSMKASAAFRLMEANLQRGVFDRALLLRYLRLPRVSPIVHRQWLERSGQKANLSDDFMEIAMLPPVRNEEPVVRAHLEHFLRDAPNADAFAQYLQPSYLRRVLAETKLLYGVGDEAQWYKLLTASERQRIRDAIELTLTADNPKRFAGDQPAELIVDVKHIDELVVRIYEINTQSYYRTHTRLIDTDIDLDGLIATHERKLSYHNPAIRRHREVIELPEIHGRGVWIVDLVGKGVRARALVRRGDIDHVDSFAADGMVFTIIDENRRPVPTATMWVGSREFVADDQGRIMLPPVVDDIRRRAIISDGTLAEPVTFQHLLERYQLRAGMHLDRTHLQSGGRAELLIRPRLLMGSTIVDPKLLKNVSVRIEATDLDDLSTTHQITGLELNQNAELVVPIRVPARLTRMNVVISGTIDALADGKEQSLQTSRSWDIAGIRRTHHTHDSFLARDGEQYVIEVRGRNGELVPQATVTIALTTRFRNSPVERTLQSNQAGQIRLGTLEGVTQIEHSVPSGLRHQRNLGLDQVRWADEIYTSVGRPVQLPLAKRVDNVTSRFRLLEVRAGSYHADHNELMSSDNCMLAIASLPAGDYHLVDRNNGRRYTIAVVDGPEIGLVVAGRVRHRSMSPARPFAIASIQRNESGLKVQLTGNTSVARVHVYASRYFDQTMPLPQLGLPFPVVRGRRVVLPTSGYVSDLRLGDEYQYVLRRRYANKYPGVMLPQPGILLNPWQTEVTANKTQSVDAGESPPPMPAAEAEAAYDSLARDSESRAALVASDYGFLADPGVVIANLRPNQDGVVTVPADAIDGLPILQIVAADPATLIQRTVTAPMNEIETVDLRLAKALDAQKPLSFERGVSIASPDQPLDLQSLGTAQLQVYASIGELLKLYKTLVDDSRLADFDPLASWHQLDRQAKLDAYARLASHELHLFLWFHDRSFFDQVIEPYLKNKKEKQFIDHWLLQNDLSQYTSLWRYNQLNAAERALLAMRVPGVRQSIIRELNEVVERKDENYAAVRLNIETALKNNQFRYDVEKEGLALGFQSKVRAQTFGVDKNMSMVDLFGDAGIADRQESRGRRKQEAEEMSADLLFEADAGMGGAMFGGRGIAGGMMKGADGAFFRNLDSTKQWAESHWDRVRTVGGPAPASLIDVDPFWAGLAQSSANNIGVSPELLRPVGNRHSALVALAMCGLPLSPSDVGLPTEPGAEFRPAHALAVVTKRLKTLQPAVGDTSILVGQRFLPLEPSKRSKKEASTEPSEFLVGIPYRGQIVVSNPTSDRRVVDVFWQLPAGSIPLSASQVTDSRTVQLEPFAVQAIEYQFYFPKPGEFTHYPSTVSADDRLIAQSSSKAFTVVNQPTEQTAVTWDRVARSGTPAEISDFLNHANLRDLDWMLVAHRMNDQEVYKVVIDVLDRANLPVQQLWAYSMVHRDEPSMREFLSIRDDLATRVGPVLNSPLLAVDPVDRRMHELLEYAPLVRARVHRLGDEDVILNATFRRQYQSFVRTLAFVPEISNEEKLVLSYYLLIQNRIQQAIETFADVDRTNVDTQLQYDYLDAYLAMHREQYDHAEAIARRHANHQVARWADRFAQLALQLQQRRDLNQTERLVSVDQPEGGKKIREGSGDLSVIDREIRQAAASDRQPEVIVRVEGDRLRIDHRRAKSATLNFYGVDLELLFSKAPFVREDLQRMAMVRPMRSEELEFDGSNGVAQFDLGGNLRRQTLLVEVVAGASRSTALYYGGDITTYVSESFGQLQTTDAESHQPVSTAYVKVYARYPGGQVRFYKDGYTDSRGRFDYASISAAEAQGAKRFAILVISDEKGATLHDVAAPNR